MDAKVASIKKQQIVNITDILVEKLVKSLPKIDVYRYDSISTTSSYLCIYCERVFQIRISDHHDSKNHKCRFSLRTDINKIQKTFGRYKIISSMYPVSAIDKLVAEVVDNVKLQQNSFYHAVGCTKEHLSKKLKFDKTNYMRVDNGEYLSA